MILRQLILLLLFYATLWTTTVEGGITMLSTQNLDIVLKSAQVVFVAFCADWCPFSRRLKPIFEEAADKFGKEQPTKSVVWAVVDSVQQSGVADKYFVNKYPTMKVFVNGELIQKEYRGGRTVEALTEFVQKQLDTAINEFPNVAELHSLMIRGKRNVVAYFARRDGPEFQNFQKVASLLKDDCSFWVGHDEALKAVNGNSMSFMDIDSDDEMKFNGNFADYEYVKNWLTDKCIPLVREVTFENVEELTEEGLPFLIFFRDPNDRDGDKMFREQVERELHDQKAGVTALYADGHKFAHPLRHLGKTAKDLPLIAIDSFQHMFLFPDMRELTTPGKLRQFILDLHSGKLHKDFHATLDDRVAELQKVQAQLDAQDEANGKTHQHGGNGPPGVYPPGSNTQPPESIFKELKPSAKRYSLLQKTEL